MNKEIKLKPVTFQKGQYNYHRDNRFQQNLLLKAMQITTDPQKLKEMIGVKRVSDVYRTLDKLAIRKEYHEALVRAGIDLDTIIGGIKRVTETASPAIQLQAWQTLMKSLGLDRYEEATEDKIKGWEETLLKIDEEKETKSDVKRLEESIEVDDYEVIVPETPEEEKKKIAEEEEAGHELYETNK